MTMSLAMTLVQFGDAIVGFTNHDALKTFGPASLALVTAVALIFFRRSYMLAADSVEGDGLKGDAKVRGIAHR
jgi:hypothetical protein